MNLRPTILWWAGLTILLLHCNLTSASLIASSEIQMCQRTSAAFEPMFGTGEACKKKFVVSLAVQSGQGKSNAIYANIKFVDNHTSVVHRKEQMKKPFRISVTKSDVLVNYPLRYYGSVNNNPWEISYRVRNPILGINKCRVRHCRGLQGYCCYSSSAEKLSKAWEYKRGHGHKEGHYFSHKYSHAVCMGKDILWYHVYDIGDPYVSYNINVTVQQFDFKTTSLADQQQGEEGKEVWSTLGYAEIGPQRMGDNTERQNKAKTSGPQIVATWHGDFSTNANFMSFRSKYLLVPDWRASTTTNAEEIAHIQEHPQVRGGAENWLLVDKHMVDISGRTCNKIGSNAVAFKAQEGRCYQMKGSCFQVTTGKIFEAAKKMQSRGLPTHYFPGFYGDFIGPHRNKQQQEGESSLQKEEGPEVEEGPEANKGPRAGKGSKESSLQKQEGPKVEEGPEANKEKGPKAGMGPEADDFLLVYRSNQMQRSLVTLSFTADSISFVVNRSPGRIVEALVEDFQALGGAGGLTVVVQNTGTVTSEYSLSIGQCSEGIIQVSEKSKTIDPRQQKTFVFEISASLNIDFDHNCSILLSDRDANVLDLKTISFKTYEGCIYCPAGKCDCDCIPEGREEAGNLLCAAANLTDYINPFWKPNIVVLPPCYHCWFTNSFKSPFTATFTIVVSLLSLGMLKMLAMHICCRTKDGRYIDVAGVIMGTTNAEHTWKKQRSATLQFLLGACFFVYLPLMPLLIVLCTWRRHIKAKKRLKKKAKRKQQRLMAKKQAALLAMKGMMVQEGMTMDEALKVMEEGQKLPDRPAPTLPPKLLVVSSSDTGERDFNYHTSSESGEGLTSLLPAFLRRRPAPVPEPASRGEQSKCRKRKGMADRKGGNRMRRAVRDVINSKFGEADLQCSPGKRDKGRRKRRKAINADRKKLKKPPASVGGETFRRERHRKSRDGKRKGPRVPKTKCKSKDQKSVKLNQPHTDSSLSELELTSYSKSSHETSRSSEDSSAESEGSHSSTDESASSFDSDKQSVDFESNFDDSSNDSDDRSDDSDDDDDDDDDDDSDDDDDDDDDDDSDDDDDDSDDDDDDYDSS